MPLFSIIHTVRNSTINKQFPTFYINMALLPAHEPCITIKILYYKHNYIVNILFEVDIYFLIYLKKYKVAKFRKIMKKKKSLKNEFVVGFNIKHHLV